jgi:YbbR domain-containing protein
LKIENLRDYLVISNNLIEIIKIEVKEKKNILDKITADDFNVRLDLKNVETPKDKLRVKVLYDVPKQMSSLFGSIKLDPEYIELDIEKLIEKKVNITADTTGKPADGYRIGKIIIDPLKTTILGPKSILDKITTVKTETINIDGVKDSFSIDVNLNTEYNNVKGLKKVNIYFEVIRETNVYTFETNKLYFQNLKNQLKAEIDTNLQIKIEGNESEITNTMIESMTFYVDCVNISKPGDYELYIRVKNPNNLKIISIIPERIIVRIKNR